MHAPVSTQALHWPALRVLTEYVIKPCMQVSYPLIKSRPLLGLPSSSSAPVSRGCSPFHFPFPSPKTSLMSSVVWCSLYFSWLDHTTKTKPTPPIPSCQSLIPRNTHYETASGHTWQGLRSVNYAIIPSFYYDLSILTLSPQTIFCLQVPLLLLQFHPLENPTLGLYQIPLTISPLSCKVILTITY